MQVRSCFLLFYLKLEYYVEISPKLESLKVTENDFINEMLTQSVRHQVYLQTKNIRELLLARAMATSVIVEESLVDDLDYDDAFNENKILKDWFVANEEVEG